MTLLLLMTWTCPVSAQNSPMILDMAPAGDMPGTAMLRGIRYFPDAPFKLDFVMESLRDPFGDSVHSPQKDAPAIEDVGLRLIKYFLTALTVPEKDLWVNLSPYEADRVVDSHLGQTLMGRDMLDQDADLKRITGRLLSPDTSSGKIFWDELYRVLAKQKISTELGVDYFNKVWIVPESAVIFEGRQEVYLMDFKLKVMLESDHEAQMRQEVKASDEQQRLAEELMRRQIVPELEKRVNESAQFAVLRQICASFILAVWYKEKLSNILLSKVYADQGKIAGIEHGSPGAINWIYRRYVQGFKSKLNNKIWEFQDSLSGEVIPRKCFTGGIWLKKPEVTLVGDKAQFSSWKQNALRLTAWFILSASLTQSMPSALGIAAEPLPAQNPAEIAAQQQEEAADVEMEIMNWLEESLLEYLQAAASNSSKVEELGAGLIVEAGKISSPLEEAAKMLVAYVQKKGYKTAQERRELEGKIEQLNKTFLVPLGGCYLNLDFHENKERTESWLSYNIYYIQSSEKVTVAGRTLDLFTSQGMGSFQPQGLILGISMADRNTIIIDSQRILLMALELREILYETASSGDKLLDAELRRIFNKAPLEQIVRRCMSVIRFHEIFHQYFSGEVSPLLTSKRQEMIKEFEVIAPEEREGVSAEVLALLAEVAFSKDPGFAITQRIARPLSLAEDQMHGGYPEMLALLILEGKPTTGLKKIPSRDEVKGHYKKVVARSAAAQERARQFLKGVVGAEVFQELSDHARREDFAMTVLAHYLARHKLIGEAMIGQYPDRVGGIDLDAEFLKMKIQQSANKDAPGGQAFPVFGDDQLERMRQAIKGLTVNIDRIDAVSLPTTLLQK